MYLQPTYLATTVFQKVYFRKWLKCNEKYSRIKKRNHLTEKHTYAHTQTDTLTHTHTHNLDFSANYGVHPPLFMFEFDFHQVLLCLLLCYVLLVHQLYFWFKFYLIQFFSGYFPFWFLIGDLQYLTQWKYSVGRRTDKILNINYWGNIFPNPTNGFRFPLKY